MVSSIASIVRPKRLHEGWARNAAILRRPKGARTAPVIPSLAPARGADALLELLTILPRVGGQATVIKATTKMGGADVNRPRAADDFATIRARMEELRREREGAKHSDKEAQRDPPMPRPYAIRWPPSEIGAGSGRVRRSGSGGG